MIKKKKEDKCDEPNFYHYIFTKKYQIKKDLRV
jgi:hypothetical protein